MAHEEPWSDFPTPVGANKVEEIGPDGTKVNHLRTAHGKCYLLVRTLCGALMGKVKLGAECVRDPATGSWTLSNDASGHPHYVAIKQLSKACIREGRTLDGRRVKEDPVNEIRMMWYLNSPGHVNVLRLIELLEDAERLYLVLEFANGGELFDVVQKHGKVPEAEARNLFWQCLQGVKYMHAKGVGHRDLSLENAMLSTHPVAGVVKIIDFGLTVYLPPLNLGLKADGRVGKERYQAPETYALIPYDPRRVDVWTLGMMLFVMLFGVYPYQVASPAACAYFHEIAEGRLVQLLQGWNFTALVSPDALSLVNRILTADPARRPTIEEIEAHAWFKNFVPAVPVGFFPPPVIVSFAPPPSHTPPAEQQQQQRQQR